MVVYAPGYNQKPIGNALTTPFFGFNVCVVKTEKTKSIFASVNSATLTTQNVNITLYTQRCCCLISLVFYVTVEMVPEMHGPGTNITWGGVDLQYVPKKCHSNYF